MQITNPENTFQLTTSQSTGKNWQLGQVVHATVVSSTTQGQAVLNIGGDKITSSLKMDRLLQQGERLQLEVIKSGIPVVFKVAASDSSQEVIMRKAMRHLLPRQIPLENMLNNISPLISNSSANPATQQMMTRLLAAIPRLKQLTAGEKVEQAIGNSGIFLENKLAQPSSSAITRDFKAALLRLLGSLKNPSERISSATNQPTRDAIQQLESGLARLQVKQLNSIASYGTEWLVELPVKLDNERQFDTLRMKIRRNKDSDNSPDHPIWSVSLEFELQELGPVQTSITLVGGKQISIGIWAQQEKTAKQFASCRDILQSSLAKANLTILNLSCHHGKMPDSISPENRIEQKLLDITV